MLRIGKHWGLLVAMGIMTGMGTVQAKVPNVGDVAGSVEKHNQELRGYYEESRADGTAPKNRLEAEPLVPGVETADQGISFQVKEIRVSHSAFLSDEELLAALAFSGPHEMTVGDLQAIVRRINALYEKKGIATAMAVLPPQKVTDGMVQIRLIEGHYSKVKIKGNRRIMEEGLRDRMKIKSGDLADLRYLSERLRLYNRTNRWPIAARVVPGEKEGESDVELTLSEPDNPLSSYIFTDNAGQKNSGAYRIGAYTEMRGLNGTDDMFTVSPVWTEGVWSGSASYDFPVGLDGWRLQTGFARNVVKIVDGQFQDYHIRANANDFSVSLNMPLNLAPAGELDGFISGHRKWSDTTILGEPLSQVVTRTISVGVSGRSYDRNGLWYGSMSLTGYQGHYELSGDDRGGSYYSLYLLRRQKMKQNAQLDWRLCGQYTEFGQLPSTEQITIGGMASVRGYQESVFSGDFGFYTSLEYGVPLCQRNMAWRGLVFCDYGAVWNRYDGKEKMRSYLLSSGLGVEYSKGNWYGKAVLGFPLQNAGAELGNGARLHVYLQRNL